MLKFALSETPSNRFCTAHAVLPFGRWRRAGRASASYRVLLCASGSPARVLGRGLVGIPLAPEDRSVVGPRRLGPASGGWRPGAEPLSHTAGGEIGRPEALQAALPVVDRFATSSDRRDLRMERVMGFEPTTLTLARSGAKRA